MKTVEKAQQANSNYCNIISCHETMFVQCLTVAELTLVQVSYAN